MKPLHTYYPDDKRIGIMGGTFDPIHKGHLSIAKQALTEYALDRVYFMPTGDPPHKTNTLRTPALHREAMVRLAIEDEPGFAYSDMELRREGKTYTTETLTYFQEEHPGASLYFIVGADSLYSMENWYRPDEILEKATVLAAERESGDHARLLEQLLHLRETFNARIFLLSGEIVPISSHEIREAGANGTLTGDYLPEAVYSYIKQNGLYQS